MKLLIVSICIILLTPIFGQTQESPNILDSILSEVGFTRDDLGYRPTGYWNRFPLDVQYKLTSFDALFSEPLKLYDYATVMANTVELYLDPAYSDSVHDGLYKLTYNLGVDKKLGGFRSYSANLLDAPTGEEPMVAALDRLFTQAGRATEFHTFGTKADWPDYKQQMRDQCAGLPDSVNIVVAQLLLNLADAIRWRELAFRNCDREDMQRAFNIRDLADTQSDGMVYYQELDDIAGSIDWPSLHYAALKIAAAVEQAEFGLVRFINEVPNDFELDINTPFGKVAMFSAHHKGVYEFDATNSLLVIDFGRNTHYWGTPGATASLSNPVSVLLDLSGDDIYGDNENMNAPLSGVGLLGVGLLLDSKGDDQYFGSTFAQGAGLFGIGILLDRDGDDSYNADLSAQGAGYFGIGICLDALGDDTYYLYGDGQGMGGIGGGVGICASFSGNDKYTAEPFTKIYNRGDYHSENKINGNNAQGVGFGRRGDGSDGHAWAGGLGAIIDIHGDDHYFSGNWSLGVGYWFATGIAVDRHGDDIYESCYFTQGSGAHYCNGILLDENGNDRHELFETAGAALGFGWDYANSLLINKNGNDIYRAKIISMGLAQIRSNAFLIDIGGDDIYYLGKGTPGLGEATYRADYLKPSRLTPYYTYAKSIGAFIDIGGADQYFEFNEDSNIEHSVASNNKLWLQPSRSDSTFGANNFGIGIDTDSGSVPDFIKWE